MRVSIATIAAQHRLEELVLLNCATLHAKVLGFAPEGFLDLPDGRLGSIPTGYIDQLVWFYRTSGGRTCLPPGELQGADPGATWPGARSPVSDMAGEEQRVSAYWRWLDGHFRADTEHQQRHALDGGWSWVSLDNEESADYEAMHMRHSIGHSWRKYSSMGDIFSLRDPTNNPQATALIDYGKAQIIHAREHHNARLSEANYERMVHLAHFRGLGIAPEHHAVLGRDPAFECWASGTGPNTRVEYLSRDRDNRKVFAEAVFPGGVHFADLLALQTLIRRGEFHPRWLGLPAIADGGRHEIKTISDTTDNPNQPTPLSEMIANWGMGVGPVPR